MAFAVMAYVVMACTVMACTVMACAVMACIVMACIAVACIAMACLVMACISTACTAMAYLTMAYMAMASRLRLYSYDLYSCGPYSYGPYSYGRPLLSALSDRSEARSLHRLYLGIAAQVCSGKGFYPRPGPAKVYIGIADGDAKMEPAARRTGLLGQRLLLRAVWRGAADLLIPARHHRAVHEVQVPGTCVDAARRHA